MILYWPDDTNTCDENGDIFLSLTGRVLATLAFICPFMPH